MTTNETMEYEVGDLVMVTKDIQFKINNDIWLTFGKDNYRTVFQGDTGTVTASGKVPNLWGGMVHMVTVSIDGVQYNFLPKDICYKL